MKAKSMALLGLAAAVAVGPHLMLAAIWYTGGALPARFAGGGFQAGPAFGLPDLFQAGPQGQACTRDELQAMRGAVVPIREYKVSGPVTHANLSVYRIHGRDTLKGAKVLPLQSALAQDLAVVHEGALAIDNLAAVPVFIQSGDIVKGGSQDRVLSSDTLVAPGSHRLPLSVFCVEAGRCGPRGQELSHSFQSATEQLPGKRLHLAARHRRSQIDVWNGVSDVQRALACNVGGSVQSPLSQTSLQLTLENGLVQQSIQDYLAKVAPLPPDESDAIGMVVVVNNEIQSADIYASAELFRELWPKLVKASAVAALAERNGEAPQAAPSAKAVHRFLAQMEQSENCRHDLAEGTRVLQQETEQGLLFDTCDLSRQNLVLHRSILAK
jgi:hypothetical protein